MLGGGSAGAVGSPMCDTSVCQKSAGASEENDAHHVAV